MSTTRVVRHLDAPRERVYRALIEPEAVRGWQVPAGTVSYTLADANGGTLLTGVHENLPPGVAPADNQAGWNMSIDGLAALVSSVR